VKICEFGGCNAKAKKKYNGYFKYHLCPKHYNIIYRYFCEYIYNLNDGICAECGSNQNLQVHHKVFRSQGGRNTVENCVLLCQVCHSKAHGIKMITY